ncbi:hypothetical protein BASA62_000656 [Batrachochytrium salamandrivorans]|nr:hypothetical protein BASA62_000656 [Batrachochytrium salamandrivorans]
MQLSVLLILAASVVYELSAEGIDTPLGDQRGSRRTNKDLWRTPMLVLRAFSCDAKPSKESVAQWYDPSAGENSGVIAGMKIAASVPSVNLDNIEGVSSITCTENKVTMVTTSITDCLDWNLEKTLLLIDVKHNCGVKREEKFNMLLATTWTVDIKSLTVVFETIDPEAAGVTGTYDIVATPGVHLNTHKQPKEKIVKSNGKKKSRCPVLFDKTKNMRLNVDASINRNFDLRSLDGDTSIHMGCNPCTLKGESMIIIKANGRLFKRPEISVTWEGNVDVIAMISFKADVSMTKESNEITLLQYPIGAIHIPGILTVGPTLTLNARGQVVVSGSVDADIAFSSSLPNFHAKISTIEKKRVSGFSPVYSITADVNAAIQGKAQLVLAPKLELSASIFNHKVEAISISLDAEMGMTFEMCAKLEAEGSSSKAISGSAEATVSVALDISTSVNANLFGSDISLYSSKSFEMFKKCRVVKTNFEKPPKPLQTAA